MGYSARYHATSLIAVFLALAWLGPTTRRLSALGAPIVVTGIAYDFLRLFKDWRQAVHVADLHAAEHAVFGTPEAKRGLLPGGGSISRLPRQIPYARAMEMLLIGDSFSAAEALAMGLLNAVVPREALMAKARSWAEKLAGNGPLAVRKIKEGVVRSSGLPLAQALAIENEVSAAVLASKDAREGPRAFQEKRKPRFTGE